MNARCFAFFLLILSAPVLAYAQCNGNDANAPCFTNNADILDAGPRFSRMTTSSSMV